MAAGDTGQDVLGEVVRILCEVMGEDFPPDTRIGPETTLHGDLALESIESVALAERLQARYGAAVELGTFVAGLDLDQIMAMTVGDLVDHIEERLRAPHPQPAR